MGLSGHRRAPLDGPGQGLRREGAEVRAGALDRRQPPDGIDAGLADRHRLQNGLERCLEREEPAPGRGRDSRLGAGVNGPIARAGRRGDRCPVPLAGAGGDAGGGVNSPETERKSLPTFWKCPSTLPLLPRHCGFSRDRAKISAENRRSLERFRFAGRHWLFSPDIANSPGTKRQCLRKLAILWRNFRSSGDIAAPPSTLRILPRRSGNVRGESAISGEIFVCRPTLAFLSRHGGFSRDEAAMSAEIGRSLERFRFVG